MEKVFHWELTEIHATTHENECSLQPNLHKYSVPHKFISVFTKFETELKY